MSRIFISYQRLNSCILFLMFLLLPVDMVNGIMLENNINLPISISQLYKIVVLSLMFFKLYFSSKTLNTIYILFGAMMLGSLIESVTNFRFGFLFSDLIKATKYLSLVVAYMFFKGVFKENDDNTIKLVFKWVSFSYWVLAFNIFIKIFHLGYPMYELGIGTRGYFYAGNEISALLLVLSSVIAYKYWAIEDKKLKFLSFFIFNILLGVLIASKTGVLGIFMVFVFIALNLKSINIKTLRVILFSILLVLPFIAYLTYKVILNSPVMIRLKYFWEKLDFMTFIFSSRNLFAERMFEIYDTDFTFVQKLFGGGQEYYESKLTHIIEIDFLDVFFAYGYLGAFLLCFSLGLVFIQSFVLKSYSGYPFAKLSFIMIGIVLIVSSIAGHVLNSGVAGNFIGLVFALMFLKRDEKQIFV